MLWSHKSIMKQRISWCLCGTWNGIVRELLWREWIIISQLHCIWEKGYKRMESSQEALYCCYGCLALRLAREISESGMQGRSVWSKWSHKRKSHTGLGSMSWARSIFTWFQDNCSNSDVIWKANIEPSHFFIHLYIYTYTPTYT